MSRQPEGFAVLARRAVARGESRVLPIAVGGKNPLMKWKGSDLDVLPEAEWLQKVDIFIDAVEKMFPDANCCVVAKSDEKCFIDEDSDDFRKGFEEWAMMPFPRTFTTSARAGHRQSHWLQTDKTRALGNVGQDQTLNGVLSFRQHNLYVLSEGSQYKDGVHYYDVVDDSPIAPMPDALVEYIQHLMEQQKTTKPKKENGDEVSTVDLDSPFVRGTLHPRLVSIAGHYIQNKNIDNADDMYTLLTARLDKNGCVESDNTTPFSYDADKVRVIAENTVASWKTGEQKRKESQLTLNQQPSNPISVLKVSNEAVTAEEDADPIPPFDPSVVNGIYKKFVDVATRGTTMVPQFVYAIAKTVVGARMAGKVKFKNLDVEPRFYTALIGETGSGKGEAWRRVFQILNHEAQIGNVSKLKIINSADSGAGIRDAFFEPPEDVPMVMYIDEVESFGNKAAATRAAPRAALGAAAFSSRYWEELV